MALDKYRELSQKEKIVKENTQEIGTRICVKRQSRTK